MASDSINPTTPADAQFEAALKEQWFKEFGERLTINNWRHVRLIKWAREWERKRVLESEPVRALVETLKRHTSHYECEDCWYSCATLTCADNRKGPCDCGAAEVIEVLAAFERAKGDK